MIQNFPDLVQQIFTNKDMQLYLDNSGLSDGLEWNKNHSAFKCLNRNHNDNSPSMSVTPRGSHVKCFSCGFIADPIDLHSHINDRNMHGEDFVNTVKEVADILEIQYTVADPSPEDIKKEAYYQAYKAVASLVVERNIDQELYNDKKITSFITERKWSWDVLAKMGVGMLSEETMAKLLSFDINEFNLTARQEGWEIFGPNKLIYCLLDNTKGKVVGFSSRDVTRGKESPIPKYIVSRSEVPTFNKRSLVFNLYNANKAMKVIDENQRSKTLFVFEGQPSSITFAHHGMFNSCAIMGNMPSEEQILSIVKASSDITFCFDGDKGGIEGLRRVFKEYSKLLANCSVKVKSMPEGYDPDEYIRANGINEFMKIPSSSMFEWALADAENSGIKDDKLVTYMAPIIATIGSPITREKNCRTLAIKTDYSLETVLEEVNLIVNKVEINANKKVKDIADEVALKIKHDPLSAIAILDEAKTKVDLVRSNIRTDVVSGDFCLSQIEEYKLASEAAGADFPGYKLPLLGGLANALNNDWSKGKMFNFGGDENTGKTSFSCFFMYNLVIGNPGLRAIYMTIDDSVQDLYKKFISIAGRHLTTGMDGYPDGFPLTINMVTRPAYWTDYLMATSPKDVPKMQKAYGLGYAWLEKVIKEERLIITGIPFIDKLSDFFGAIRTLRKKYPDQDEENNIVAYVDNIHKFSLPPGTVSPHLAWKDISGALKQESVRSACSVGGTLEYNSDKTKRGKDNRPTNESLAETRAFRYDTNFLCHLYNHMHHYSVDSPWYHSVKYNWDNQTLKMPTIEAIIGKNKISGDKGVHYLDFYPDQSYFKYIEPMTALLRAKNNDGGGAFPSNNSSSSVQELPFLDVDQEYE
jgi:DNA primase catalytic core